MNDAPEEDGPGGRLVEGDVLVEGDDVVKRCTTQHGDKVAANGKQDEDDINVQDHGGSASDSECDTEIASSLGQVVLELVMEETKNGDKEMEEHPDTKEELPATLVDHPEVEFLHESLGANGSFGTGIGERTLETLQTPALSLVALEMGGRATVGEVGMLVELRGSIGEIETTHDVKSLMDVRRGRENKREGKGRPACWSNKR